MNYPLNPNCPKQFILLKEMLHNKFGKSKEVVDPHEWVYFIPDLLAPFEKKEQLEIIKLLRSKYINWNPYRFWMYLDIKTRLLPPEALKRAEDLLYNRINLCTESNPESTTKS